MPTTPRLLLQVVSFLPRDAEAIAGSAGVPGKRGLKSSGDDRATSGWASPIARWAYRLPAQESQAGAEMRGRLQKLGILRETGHEHFNGSLVVPVFDRTGQVVEMYGRKIS